MLILSKLKRNCRRGFTLTELAIVVGIIGSILGAIWMASSSVNGNAKGQKALTETMQILTGYDRSMLNVASTRLRGSGRMLHAWGWLPEFFLPICCSVALIAIATRPTAIRVLRGVWHRWLVL